MACAREQLELGSAPSAIKRVIDAYLNHEINEKEFEDLCHESIYIIDLDYLKDKFRVNSKPEEEAREYDFPAAFYGASFGDIAGSAYEFGTGDKKRSELNFHNCITNFSTPTDDTIGAIAGGIAGAYYGIPEYAKKIVDARKPEKIFDAAIAAMNTN